MEEVALQPLTEFPGSTHAQTEVSLTGREAVAEKAAEAAKAPREAPGELVERVLLVLS